jgi:outer membrane lipoprotein carrier protein
LKHFLAMLVSLLLICLSAPAHAAGGAALEAMETLRRGFAGSNDFTADIRQEKRLSLMKQTLVSRGVVRFKKPDLFFMELLPPHASRLLLKDNVLVMRLPEQGVTDRIVLPPEDSLKKWFDYLAKPIHSLPEGVEVKAELRGNTWTVHIFPQASGAVAMLTLKFDLEGNIGRIIIEERNHDGTTLVFSKLRRNVGLQDKDFRVE